MATSITPSHIIQYLYCPRYTYFEYVLGIPRFEEKYYKVMKGREMHDEKLERNKPYLRKRIGVKEKFLDVYMTNDYLRGRLDEVIVLEDGTMAPLDYKFAEYNERVFQTTRTQLFCYALLIQENFGTEVNRGYIVYIRSHNKLVEVPITQEDKAYVKKCLEEIIAIIEGNVFPRATTTKKKCEECSYRNICIK